MFKVGAWVNINESYRQRGGADSHAFYGQVLRVDGNSPNGGGDVYLVHCNSDKIHYFFEEELTLIPEERIEGE